MTIIINGYKIYSSLVVKALEEKLKATINSSIYCRPYGKKFTVRFLKINNDGTERRMKCTLSLAYYGESIEPIGYNISNIRND